MCRRNLHIGLGSNKPIEMADSVLFIQIVDTSKLVRGKTAKLKQWKALEKSINKIIPITDSQMKQYKLLTTEELQDLPLNRPTSPAANSMT